MIADQLFCDRGGRNREPGRRDERQVEPAGPYRLAALHQRLVRPHASDHTQRHCPDKDGEAVGNLGPRQHHADHDRDIPASRRAA